MGQTNSGRVSHNVDAQPNVYRDDQVEQIINDLAEEDTGKGFSEVFYVGATPFVGYIITWDSPSKIKQRTRVEFTYSPSPFLSQILKRVYDEATGLTEVARITAVFSYNVNKTINTVDVTTQRF